MRFCFHLSAIAEAAPSLSVHVRKTALALRTPDPFGGYAR